MANQPHIQTGLVHTPECWQFGGETQLHTWQAVCRCGKVLRGRTRKTLTTNQKRHYTICTARHVRFNTETLEVEYDSTSE